ncbi:4Fe-4S binding protein [Infirmifilum sp.]|uniref:4Fe-4S binding protein n=1 Tax=Infirmifilum sp. TaxID=2856575 RepID=UPI003D12E4B6
MVKSGFVKLLCMSFANLLGRPRTLAIDEAAQNSMSRGRPVLNIEKCLGCGLCGRSCPPGAITMITVGKQIVGGREIDKKAPRFDYLRCIYCGLCSDVCPARAIRMEESFTIEYAFEVALLPLSTDPRVGAILAFAFIFLVSLSVYLISGLLSPKGEHTDKAFDPFTGGTPQTTHLERYYIPGLFSFVLFFLITEIAVFLILLRPALYVLLLVLITLAALMVEGIELLRRLR